MYAQNHRSVLNGTPLDDRFTNMAREARRAGYDPRSSATPTRARPPHASPPTTPGSRTYEGVLPGFDAALFNPRVGRLAWHGPTG